MARRAKSLAGQLRGICRFVGIAGTAFLALGWSAAASAELQMPVPVALVYPGQSIVERGLSVGDFVVKDDKVALFVLDETMLEGMVAKRTLLPGNAIRLTDIALPDLVKAGAQVTLVYREEGLVITGLGTALRSGSEGQEVTVRNLDSGTIVSGVVDRDGTIRIQG